MPGHALAIGRPRRSGTGLHRGIQRYWVAPVVALLVIAAVVFAIRMFGAQFDAEQFFRSFRQMDAWWLAAGLVLVLLTYVGRALRWRVMISPDRPHAKAGKLLKATMIGFTAVTLFGRPGELVRPYLIARQERLPVSSQLAAWLLERIYDLLLVLLIFGFALTRVQPHEGLGAAMQWILRTGGYFVAALGIICVSLLVSIAVFKEGAIRRIQDALTVVPEAYRTKVNDLVRAFAGGMESTRRGSFVSKIIGYTVAEWAIIIGANYCLFQSFPATRHLSLTDNAVFLGFVAFGSVVQIPGVGGGFQVAAVLVLTEIFGLTLEPATGAALLLWISMYVVVVPVGLGLTLWDGMSWSALRHIDEQVEPDKTTNVVEKAER